MSPQVHGRHRLRIHVNGSGRVVVECYFGDGIRAERERTIAREFEHVGVGESLHLRVARNQADGAVGTNGGRSRNASVLVDGQAGQSDIATICRDTPGERCGTAGVWVIGAVGNGAPVAHFYQQATQIGTIAGYEKDTLPGCQNGLAIGCGDFAAIGHLRSEDEHLATIRADAGTLFYGDRTTSERDTGLGVRLESRSSHTGCAANT